MSRSVTNTVKWCIKAMAYVQFFNFLVRLFFKCGIFKPRLIFECGLCATWVWRRCSFYAQLYSTLRLCRPTLWLETKRYWSNCKGAVYTLHTCIFVSTECLMIDTFLILRCSLCCLVSVVLQIWKVFWVGYHTRSTIEDFSCRQSSENVLPFILKFAQQFV